MVCVEWQTIINISWVINIILDGQYQQWQTNWISPTAGAYMNE
jgi:hypothetical protein